MLGGISKYVPASLSCMPKYSAVGLLVMRGSPRSSFQRGSGCGMKRYMGFGILKMSPLTRLYSGLSFSAWYWPGYFSVILVGSMVYARGFG